MMMLRVFLEANRIRLHTGRPRTRFLTSFLSSSSAEHRRGPRNLTRRIEAAERAGVTASSTRQEGPAVAAAATPGCRGSAHDADATEEAMPIAATAAAVVATASEQVLVLFVVFGE